MKRPALLGASFFLLASISSEHKTAAAEQKTSGFLVATTRGFGVIADGNLRSVFVGPMAVPGYPYEGRRDYWSGSGIFRAFVTPEGKVTSVTVVKSTGFKVMDESVVSASGGWRAKPGRKREVDFPITFVAPPRRGMPGSGS